MLICEIVSSRHFLLTLVYMDPPLTQSHTSKLGVKMGVLIVFRCENGCVDSIFFLPCNGYS